MVLDTDIAKLPKWAQQHIKDLKRERDIAVRALNEWTDAQTPGPIFVDELVSTGEQQGPSTKRRYIQGRRVTCDWLGVRLEVMLRKEYIDLQWSNPERLCSDDVAFIPSSFMAARLIAVQPKPIDKPARPVA